MFPAYLVLLMTTIATVTRSQRAAANEIVDYKYIERAIESQIEKYGATAEERVVRYKLEVEVHAVDTTWKLCEGYKRARTLVSLGQRTSHIPLVYSATDSAEVWAKVFINGLMVTFSNQFGIKADWEQGGGIAQHWIKRWFQSLYVLYLLDSDSFYGVAINCLESTDGREIRAFAAAILYADTVGSLMGYGSEFIAVGGAFAALGNFFRFALSPERFLVQAVRARIPWLNAGLLSDAKMVAGMIVIPIFVDDFMEKLRQGEEQKETWNSLIHAKPEIEDPSDDILAPVERVAELGQGVDLVDLVLKTRRQGTRDPQAEEKLEQFVHQKLSRDKLTIYENDLHRLNLHPHEKFTKRQRAYFSYLRVLIPIARANSES